MKITKLIEYNDLKLDEDGEKGSDLLQKVFKSQRRAAS
jgi:hypothetical protein